MYAHATIVLAKIIEKRILFTNKLIAIKLVYRITGCQ